MRGMALTITLPDIGTVRADTPAELAALVKQLRDDAAQSKAAAQPAAPKPPGAPSPAAGEGSTPEFPAFSKFDKVVAAANFLTAIQQRGARGTPSEVIQDVLGVPKDKPKGISGRTVQINSYLVSLGFNQEDVYRTERTSIGRVWGPGPKIAEALAVIRKELNDQL